MAEAGRVLITGATGLVGRGLLEQLPNAWITTRDATRAMDKLKLPREQFIEWDPATPDLRLPDSASLSGIVNLMGESVADGRWTADKKHRIRDSRVLGTQNLLRSLVAQGTLPTVMVSASAVGFYGDRGEETLVESSPPGTGFLADTCRQWEEAAQEFIHHGCRVVCLRIGLVLSRESGALPQLIRVMKWGVGGPFGWGRQWYPWIHIDDLVDLIVWSLDKAGLSGPLNATAPEPVRNRQLVAEVASRLRRPALLPVPRLAARTLLGEFGDMLFHSQRAIPQVAMEAGFQFRFGTLGRALDDLIA
ncbi:MAG TPA: TIGR01777 family oxidoreductase [Pirellulaceae bacterium]|nr:TIGR01777 family oxidoreductase [Pirellulaceae bacterium]